MKKKKKVRENQPHKLVKGDLQRIVLGSFALLGLVTLAVAAPNAVALLKFFKGHDRRYRTTYYINETVKRLEKKGFVKVIFRHGQKLVRVTPRGEMELMKYKLKEKMLEKRKWDGRWHLIIFDIKEKKRNIRDKIRTDILTLGFERLQDSVWVYPYECEDVVALLKGTCKLGREALYIVAEKIENDQWLKEKFNVVKT